MINNPFTPFLSQNGTAVLDGALATELERHGRSLNTPLWSADLLQTEPELIQRVHRDYLYAGADCLITASYQATIQGFMAHGMSEHEAADLIRTSISIAIEVRDRFWDDPTNRHGRAAPPLIAASVGPYGAYLANGAEYTGDYDLDKNGLTDFHRQRWDILAHSGADLLACETLPSLTEAEALLPLLDTSPIPAWFSFSCRDGRHISDGTPITDCANLLKNHPKVAAIGINCTPPKHLAELINATRQTCDLPIVIYPNSGEVYNPENKTWYGTADPQGFGTAASHWQALGATIIGGCCRTTPKHIQALANQIQAQ